MYQLLGLPANLRTVSVLAGGQKRGDGVRISQELKRRYQRYLGDLQPGVPRQSSHGVAFVRDRKVLARVADGFFRVDTPLNDLQQTRVIDPPERGFRWQQQRTFHRLRAALNSMRATCPELHRLVGLVVNSIFYSPSSVANGGTSSAAIGVIWINALPRQNREVLELLVHETTHTLMFLDELRYGHYLDYERIPIKRYWVRSAILGVKRPLDKVLHSLVVATEILLFRDRVTGHPASPRLHPPSDEMVASCLETLAQLRHGSPSTLNLTRRSAWLAERCERAIRHVQRLDATRAIE